MKNYIPQLDRVDIDVLLANHRPGYSLERPFYLDPLVFEEEFKHIFSRQWQYVDHINRIPRKGDWFLFRIAGEEIIIVRGEGDTVYAHFNVCRHRGSRICLENEGHGVRLTCPYHAWSYRLDGSLANARAMPDDFDPSAFGLKQCAVRLMEGLIFINLVADGETAVSSFDTIQKELAPWLERADLRRTKIVHHEVIPSKVNWKIAIENYFECYHCITTHPELCKVQLHTMRDGFIKEGPIEQFLNENEVWASRAATFGHKIGSMSSPAPETAAEAYDYQLYYAERMLLHPDLNSAYEDLNKGDLKRSTKLLGHYEKDDKGQVDWGIMPSCFAYTSCTSTVLYRITPISATECELAQTWLVHEDAVEGVDYDVEGVTWLDRVTQEQDEAIVRDTQAGVSSRFYEPGPYGKLEHHIFSLHQDYIRALRYGRGLEK